MAHQNSGEPQPFDPADPHGFHAGDEHGHVILPQKLLLGVLTILLALTLLTVASAQAEVWIMDVFHITLPWWVNILVALSIATVKSVLVLAIFMQLWFDSRLNTVAFGTCLLCVALFLGFTIGDRAQRGALHTQNAPETTQGGNAYGVNWEDIQGPVLGPDGEKINTAGMPIVELARVRAINEKYGGDEEAFKAAKAAKHKHHDTMPTANRVVVRAGLTPGLFDATEPVHGKDHHGDDHGHDHDGDRGDEEHSESDHTDPDLSETPADTPASD